MHFQMIGFIFVTAIDFFLVLLIPALDANEDKLTNPFSLAAQNLIYTNESL